MGDILQALNRIRPGREFIPPATALNPSKPGDVIVLAFTPVLSAEIVFRFSAIAGKGGAGLPPIFVSIKATAPVHVAFGPLGEVVDPTDAGALYEASDSWQDYQLEPGDTSFKLKGHTGTGTGGFWLLLSSR